MPTVLRRFIAITTYSVYPNRKLNILEKIWYNVLGFARFDSVDTIYQALDPTRVGFK